MSGKRKSYQQVSLNFAPNKTPKRAASSTITKRSRLSEWDSCTQYWELFPACVPNERTKHLYTFFTQNVKPVPDKVKMFNDEYEEKRLTGVFQR